jgi:hypothetical protein
MSYKCKPCNYETDDKTNFHRHTQTKRHINKFAKPVTELKSATPKFQLKKNPIIKSDAEKMDEYQLEIQKLKIELEYEKKTNRELKEYIMTGNGNRTYNITVDDDMNPDNVNMNFLKNILNPAFMATHYPNMSTNNVGYANDSDDSSDDECNTYIKNHINKHTVSHGPVPTKTYQKKYVAPQNTVSDDDDGLPIILGEEDEKKLSITEILIHYQRRKLMGAFLGNLIVKFYEDPAEYISPTRTQLKKKIFEILGSQEVDWRKDLRKNTIRPVFDFLVDIVNKYVEDKQAEEKKTNNKSKDLDLAIIIQKELNDPAFENKLVDGVGNTLEEKFKTRRM